MTVYVKDLPVKIGQGDKVTSLRCTGCGGTCLAARRFWRDHPAKTALRCAACDSPLALHTRTIGKGLINRFLNG